MANEDHNELCQGEGKKIDGRKKVILSEEDEIYQKIGEVVFKYDNPKDPKKNFSTSGTAFLYKQISKSCFVLKTAAHVLVQHKFDHESATYKEVKSNEGYFFL